MFRQKQLCSLTLLLTFLLWDLVQLSTCLLANRPHGRAQIPLRQVPPRQSGELEILYESDRILAVNKPEGVPHHSGDDEDGIVSTVRYHLATAQRIFGVHRLDRVTSGILLFAKDRNTASLLSRRFRDGEVTKYYCGISSRKPSKKKQGWVKGNMSRGRRKSWMLHRNSAPTQSNYAITRFFTCGLSFLDEHLSENTVRPKTLILFRPYTGRTHQLRVAAKSVGLPLLGDPVYRDGTTDSHGFAQSQSARTYLHACGIHVELDDAESVTIFSRPPFGALWNQAGSLQFTERFHSIVNKNCDCPPIQEQMRLRSLSDSK